MTTRYRVEYALKTHRRDQLIEWIKGLLAVPFVLLSQPTAVFEPRPETTEEMAAQAHRRYAEIMRDVEEILTDHVQHQKAGTGHRSKLKLLVPTVGHFFTTLSLHDAFVYQDHRRLISHRRFVAPSFNDVRLILNTAQIMSLTRAGSIELITFDGDVTLYDDGATLAPTNPVIPHILALIAAGTKIGIVTAAGYTEARRYYERLHGLLDALHASPALPEHLKRNLIILGGESNYLFKFSPTAPDRLEPVPRAAWLLDEMALWDTGDIAALLDLAELALRDCVRNMRLRALVLRKERAVGIVPDPAWGGKFAREQLEETVLVTHKILEMSDVGRRLPFCAFNGGNDVFVDIGDKSWGVRACQRFFAAEEERAGRAGSPAGYVGRAAGYLGAKEEVGSAMSNGAGVNGSAGSGAVRRSIEASRTLHVGDQFLSAGSNDFKARLAATTAWIASPEETVQLLDELAELEEMVRRKTV